MISSSALGADVGGSTCEASGVTSPEGTSWNESRVPSCVLSWSEESYSISTSLVVTSVMTAGGDRGVVLDVSVRGGGKTGIDAPPIATAALFASAISLNCSYDASPSYSTWIVCLFLLAAIVGLPPAPTGSTSGACVGPTSTSMSVDLVVWAGRGAAACRVEGPGAHDAGAIGGPGMALLGDSIAASAMTGDVWAAASTAGGTERGCRWPTGGVL